MKVVLATNVLVSGIFWKGNPSSILEKWAKDETQVFTTLEILKEVREILTELDRTLDKALSRHWLLFIAENSALNFQTVGSRALSSQCFGLPTKANTDFAPLGL